MNMIAHTIKAEVHILRTHQVVIERFALIADPLHGQTGCQVDVRFPHPSHAQFFRNRHERENVEIVVHSLVLNEFLVSLANAVINTLVFQNIAGEGGRRVICRDSGGRNGIYRFDVPIPVVHGDNFQIAQFFHCASFRCEICSAGQRQLLASAFPRWSYSFCHCARHSQDLALKLKEYFRNSEILFSVKTCPG